MVYPFIAIAQAHNPSVALRAPFLENLQQFRFLLFGKPSPPAATSAAPSAARAPSPGAVSPGPVTDHLPPALGRGLAFATAFVLGRGPAAGCQSRHAQECDE